MDEMLKARSTLPNLEATATNPVTRFVKTNAMHDDYVAAVKVIGEAADQARVDAVARRAADREAMMKDHLAALKVVADAVAESKVQG